MAPGPAVPTWAGETEIFGGAEIRDRGEAGCEGRNGF